MNIIKIEKDHNDR